MKKEDFEDFDLDVQNWFYKFPEDNNNCFLYLRGTLDEDNENLKTTFLNKGINGLFAAMIANLMIQDESFQKTMLYAVEVFIEEQEKK